MKKWLIVGALSAFVFPPAVSAESSSVQINNTVNTSTSTTTTNNSNTRVEITQNGETKVFESNDGKGVDYTSPDGKTTVKINQNIGQKSQETVDKVTEEVKGAVENSKNEITESIHKNRKDTEKIVADEVENRVQRIFIIIKDFLFSLIPK